MSEAAYIGIEIGGTKLQLVAGDAAARVLGRVRRTADRAAGAAGIPSPARHDRRAADDVSSP